MGKVPDVYHIVTRTLRAKDERWGASDIIRDARAPIVSFMKPNEHHQIIRWYQNTLNIALPAHINHAFTALHDD